MSTPVEAVTVASPTIILIIPAVTIITSLLIRYLIKLKRIACQFNFRLKLSLQKRGWLGTIRKAIKNFIT